MVESTNFFGAVRPVLERLQVLRQEHIHISLLHFLFFIFIDSNSQIPFLPTLLEGKFLVSPPPYLEMESLVDLSPVSTPVFFPLSLSSHFFSLSFFFSIFFLRIKLYENLKEITGKTEFNVLDRWPDSTLFPSLRPILDPSQFIAMKVFYNGFL
jgi:hypothetical protein